jgi:hypothetical protein
MAFVPVISSLRIPKSSLQGEDATPVYFGHLVMFLRLSSLRPSSQQTCMAAVVKLETSGYTSNSNQHNLNRMNKQTPILAQLRKK